MKGKHLIVGLALLVSACEETPSPQNAPPTSSPLVCEPGSALVEDQCKPAGFEAPAGPSTCAPGSVAFFGQTECTAVGPATCPAGFTREADGFGCVPTLTTATCTGATRPKIGATTCVPVGDCNAAFPPPGATIFVDDSFTLAQIDATHFATIQAAVAAAPSGATIAVDEGSYSGTVTLTKSVTLVGRCPAKVVLRGGSSVVTPGIDIDKNITASVRGLTVTDFELGVSVRSSADVTVEGMVVEANRRIGLLAGDAGTKLLARGVVVRGTLPDGSDRFGHGAASGFESEMTIEDSAILSSMEIGAGAQKAGILTVSRTVIDGVTQRASNRAYGWGVGTQTDGQATVSESVILDTYAAGVVASEAGTKTRLERSYVRGVRPGPTAGTSEIAAGALAQQKGASLEVEGSTIAGSDKDGILVQLGAEASISSTVVRDLKKSDTEAGIRIIAPSTAKVAKSAVVASPAIGVLSTGTADFSDLYIAKTASLGLTVRGSATVTRIRVEDLEANEAYGAGISVGEGGSLELTDATVRKVTLGLLAAGEGTKLSVRRAAIEDTVTVGEATGFGCAVAAGAAATIEDAAFTRTADAAVYLDAPGTTATLRGVSLVDTKTNGELERGRGLSVQRGANATLERVLVRGGTQVGMMVVDDSTVVADDSVFSGVATNVRGYGHGITVISASLVLRHSVTSDHSGIGLVFSGASATIASSVVRANPVGVHTLGVSLSEAQTAPEELVPDSVVFTLDTRFEENGLKVGSGEIPLPVGIETPPAISSK